MKATLQGQRKHPGLDGKTRFFKLVFFTFKFVTFLRAKGKKRFPNFL